MFSTGVRDTRERRLGMKNCLKIPFSILGAAICTVGFAADMPSCQKSGKNCPMNDKGLQLWKELRLRLVRLATLS
jgi:hypothetical protein